MVFCFPSLRGEQKTIGLSKTRVKYLTSELFCDSFIPKGRKKALYGKVRKFLGPVFHELASQRGSTIVEGHMVQDHVHMLIKIPPKYSVAEVVGYIKGKSAIAVARQFGGRQRNLNGERLWARGYAVSTVGFEEAQTRAYIKQQEQLDGVEGSQEEGSF